MPSARRNKHTALVSLKKEEGSAATLRKNQKERLRQRMRLMPRPATAEAEGRFVAAIDALLAQLAKTEVLQHLQGGLHAPER